MLESMQGLGNLSGHGKLDSVVDIMLLEGETAIFGTSPISGDGVGNVLGPCISHQKCQRPSST
jgi:hypothetical protein